MQNCCKNMTTTIWLCSSHACFISSFFLIIEMELFAAYDIKDVYYSQYFFCFLYVLRQDISYWFLSSVSFLVFVIMACFHAITYNIFSIQTLILRYSASEFYVTIFQLNMTQKSVSKSLSNCTDSNDIRCVSVMIWYDTIEINGAIIKQCGSKWFSWDSRTSSWEIQVIWVCISGTVFDVYRYDSITK